MGNDFTTPTVGTASDWDPARALVELKAQQDVVGDTNELILTSQRLLRGAPIAADVLVHLSQYGSTERIRLDAAKYLLDRVLGKSTDGLAPEGVRDPFQLLMEQCIVDSKTRGRAIEVTSSADPTPDDFLTEVEGMKTDETNS
jgi:hypothetical protein